MSRQDVLALLREQEGAFVSGEEISHRLGLSRAAIWKAVDALRREGYTVEARTGRGYRLLDAPDVLTEPEIRRFLPPTLLRGGICAFWTSAILRRNGPVSDFISCSGLYRRKGIFHRCVDENTFRTDPHICRAVTSHHIFFTLSQLSSVVLYHAP